MSFQDFEFIKPLGQGAFGGVFLVKKKASGDLYAMKLIDCSKRVFKLMNFEKLEL